MTGGHAKKRSRSARERLPKEQRAYCVASRSREQSGAQGMRRKERRPTRRVANGRHPNSEDMTVLPQLEVDGPSRRSGRLVQGQNGHRSRCNSSSMWSRLSEKGKQLYIDLVNDVERTHSWPAQIQTLIDFLVPKTPTGERPIGLVPSIVRVLERMRKPILDQWMISQTWSYDWACKGRSAEMAAWQHLVLEDWQDDKPGTGRATALLDSRSGSGTCGDGDATVASRERCSGSSSWFSAFNAVWDCGGQCRAHPGH